MRRHSESRHFFGSKLPYNEARKIMWENFAGTLYPTHLHRTIFRPNTARHFAFQELKSENKFALTHSEIDGNGPNCIFSAFENQKATSLNGT